MMVYDKKLKKAKKNLIKKYHSILDFKKKLVYSKQIHSDIIKIIQNHGFVGKCDSIVSNNKNNILGIQVADCLPIFIVNQKDNIISLVHAGWRGTFNEILVKTMIVIKKKFKVNKKDFLFFFGPSIKQCCYEVDYDVSSKFNVKYSKKINNKYMLNLNSINIEQLYSIGIKNNQIFFDKCCTFCSLKEFHSFRRDGESSGRNICFLGID